MEPYGCYCCPQRPRKRCSREIITHVTSALWGYRFTVLHVTGVLPDKTCPRVCVLFGCEREIVCVREYVCVHMYVCLRVSVCVYFCVCVDV